MLLREVLELALADLGCRRAQLVVRSQERAAETLAALARHPAAPEVGFAALGSSDVVVSTIPADAQGPEVLGLLEHTQAAFEVLYHPWPTPLSVRAAEIGLPVVGGLDLLIHQAAIQFELFTGVVAPLAQMRAAGEAALAR